MADYSDFQETTNAGIVVLKRPGTSDQKLYNYQAVNAYLASLRNRVESVEAAGVWIGTVDAIGDLPANNAALTSTQGILPGVKPNQGDFVNVRNAVYYKNSAGDISLTAQTGYKQQTGPARFIVKVDSNKQITGWDLDIVFSSEIDLSGKIDTVPSAKDEIPVFTQDGNLEGSGLGVDDVVQTGDVTQQIDGEKEFIGTLKVTNDPEDPTDVANKKYVDKLVGDIDFSDELDNKLDNLGDGDAGKVVISNADGSVARSGTDLSNLVDKSTSQTITGDKTFSGTIIIEDIDENSNGKEAANKNYVDGKIQEINESSVDWEFEVLENFGS